MADPPAPLKLTVENDDDDSKVAHSYRRKNTRVGVEYHYRETVPTATSDES